MDRSVTRGARLLGASAIAIAAASGAIAQPTANATKTTLTAVKPTARVIPLDTVNADITTLANIDAPVGTRGCPQEVDTYSSANFTGTSAVTPQGGFYEMDMFAASYELTPGDFPLQIDLIESLWATAAGTTQLTVTIWSVHVWEGDPETGTEIFNFTAEDTQVPYLRAGPGETITNIQFLIDPGDPEQIIVNDNGTSTFSVGFGIVAHNSPGTSCFPGGEPSATANAFPSTDFGDGVADRNNNWIFSGSTLPFCFTQAWYSYVELGALGAEPSGDLNIRASWTPFNCAGSTGACCQQNGTCLPGVTESACGTIQGVFQGAGTDCSNPCPPPEGACCFTGGTCSVLSAGDCSTALGDYQGDGTECDPGGLCPPEPTGACCFESGTCALLSSANCSAALGTYQGDGVSCGAATCPQPSGACCLAGGGCIDVLEANCTPIPGASWAGPLTDCGTDCGAPECPCEFGGNPDVVTSEDLLAFLALWFADGNGPPPSGSGTGADFNDDNFVDVSDLLGFLACWFPASGGGECP